MRPCPRSPHTPPFVDVASAPGRLATTVSPLRWMPQTLAAADQDFRLKKNCTTRSFIGTCAWTVFLSFSQRHARVRSRFAARVLRKLLRERPMQWLQLREARRYLLAQGSVRPRPAAAAAPRLRISALPRHKTRGAHGTRHAPRARTHRRAHAHTHAACQPLPWYALAALDQRRTEARWCHIGKKVCVQGGGLNATLTTTRHSSLHSLATQNRDLPELYEFEIIKKSCGELAHSARDGRWE